MKNADTVIKKKKKILKGKKSKQSKVPVSQLLDATRSK